MPKAREPFSILKMKEVFDECSEVLFAAIRRQNPDVSADSFDMALRQLVMNHGSAPIFHPLNQVMASVTEARPMYIEAGDVLVLAHKDFKKGQHENALKLFITAMESNHVDELMDAISLNNEKSDIGEIDHVESSDDEEDEDDTPIYEITEPEDNSDDFESDEEDDGNSDSDSGSSSDEDDSDDDDHQEIESRVQRVVSKLRIRASEDSDESVDSDEENVDEDSEDKTARMGGTSSERVNASQRDIARRAAANRMSILGTDESLSRARQLKKAS